MDEQDEVGQGVSAGLYQELAPRADMVRREALDGGPGAELISGLIYAVRDRLGTDARTRLSCRPHCETEVSKNWGPH